MNLFKKIANNIKVSKANKKLAKIQRIQSLIHSGQTGFDSDSKNLVVGYLDAKEEEVTSKLVTLLLKSRGIELTYTESTPKDETQRSESGS
jgi:hypothetical protein